MTTLILKTYGLDKFIYSQTQLFLKIFLMARQIYAIPFKKPAEEFGIMRNGDSDEN